MRAFTPEEKERVRAASAAGLVPACPRCGIPLDAEDVRPNPAVPYVRRRRVLVCPSCGAHGVLDRSEKE